MDYKEEFIKRIKYLIENAIYLIEPQNHLNMLKFYLELENTTNGRMLLKQLESLLLSDNDIQNNHLYLEVLNRKNDKDYLFKLKDHQDDLFDSFTILSLVRKFIVRCAMKEEIILKKLDALDEYFRVIRYQNNGFIYTSGAILNPKDIRNKIIIRSGIINNGVFQEDKKNSSYVYQSDFVDYLSNMKNHYQENLSILTEEEKKEIYLLFHSEKEWQIKTTCEERDIFFGKNYCHQEILVSIEDLFYFNNNFYVMCPNCYGIVLVEKDLIPSYIQESIKKEYLNKEFYLTNILYKREYLINEKQKVLQKK